MTRNKQIDGLRGMTIFLIVIFHLFCRYNEIYNGYSIWYLRWLGNFGNSIFLLISSYFLIGRVGIEINLIKFLGKKIFRLYPCYIISITLTMIATHIIELPQRTCSWKDYLFNIGFINGFIGRSYVDGAHWYITTLIGAIIVVGIIKYFQIERYVFTYFMWLFLEGLTRVTGVVPLNQLLGSSYVAIICIGIGINILLQENYNIKYFLKFTKMKEYIYVNRWIFLIITCLGYHFLRRGLQAFICLCLAIPIFLIALFQKCRIFESEILQFLGKISYPLYLIHQNIAYLIEFNLSKYYTQFSFALIATGSFLIVLLIGIGMYYLIEAPVQKLIKRCT